MSKNHRKRGSNVSRKSPTKSPTKSPMKSGMKSSRFALNSRSSMKSTPKSPPKTPKRSPKKSPNKSGLQRIRSVPSKVGNRTPKLTPKSNSKSGSKSLLRIKSLSRSPIKSPSMLGNKSSSNSMVFDNPNNLPLNSIQFNKIIEIEMNKCGNSKHEMNELFKATLLIVLKMTQKMKDNERKRHNEYKQLKLKLIEKKQRILNKIENENNKTIKLNKEINIIIKDINSYKYILSQISLINTTNIEYRKSEKICKKSIDVLIELRNTLESDYLHKYLYRDKYIYPNGLNKYKNANRPIEYGILKRRMIVNRYRYYIVLNEIKYINLIIQHCVVKFLDFSECLCDYCRQYSIEEFILGHRHGFDTLKSGKIKKNELYKTNKAIKSSNDNNNNNITNNNNNSDISSTDNNKENIGAMVNVRKGKKLRKPKRKYNKSADLNDPSSHKSMFNLGYKKVKSRKKNSNQLTPKQKPKNRRIRSSSGGDKTEVNIPDLNKIKKRKSIRRLQIERSKSEV